MKWFYPFYLLSDFHPADGVWFLIVLSFLIEINSQLFVLEAQRLKPQDIYYAINLVDHKVSSGFGTLNQCFILTLIKSSVQ